MPFDEEELDPHGECAAEIARLTAERDAANEITRDAIKYLRSIGFIDQANKLDCRFQQKQPPEMVKCTKCGASVRFGSCCDECDEPTDH